MSLYRMLAPVYDRLFPLHPMAIGFLEAVFAEGGAGLDAPPRRAFDAGSATGGHVLALAERGWEAEGIEPEAEMVAASREKAARAELATAVFHEGDMRSARALLGAEGGRFGLGLCLGNTLPHLPDADALDEFLDAARFLLAPGGSLVLQLLNYGPFGAGPLFAFPELAAGDLVMRRRYEGREGGRLRFVVELEEKGAAAGREEALLAPIPPAKLRSALARAGFPGIRLFGGWSGASFDEGGDAYLLAVARARA